jgi:hypothetical protein
MVLYQMKNEQILDDLKHLLDFLNQQHAEIKSSHDKFLIALTGILKVATGDTSLITNLHGDPEHLTSYLLQMAMQITDSTTQSYESISKRVESIIEALVIDRKS